MSDLVSLDLKAELANSLFVLSGPTSGLGRALLAVLVNASAPVVAIGRHIDRLRPSLSKFTSEGYACALVEADFALEFTDGWLEDTRREVEKLLAIYPGRSLFFLNNAGAIQPLGPAADLVPAEVNVAMRINCTVPVALSAVLVKLATKSKRDLRIVNVTTGAAQRPIAGWLAYCASKAACRMALDVIAIENPAIDVRHLDPGVVDTGMQALLRQTGVVIAGGPVPAETSKLKAPAVAATELLTKAIEAAR